MGSNNWALSGRRTASGKPLVAGDPHRPLDVPSVYYQNHLACPDLDAIGLSFAGVPGLPHFGHNAHVAWCVTHAQADYQDLYVERFDPADPRRYAFEGGWRAAEMTRETSRCAARAPVAIEITVTHHGPIVLGDPRRGAAIAFRYTATARPNRTFEALLPMLRARNADEFEEAQRPWVDPANNLVYRRRPRRHRLPHPRRDPRARPRECLAAGAGLGRRARMAGRGALRGDAGAARSRGGLHRHRQ